MGVNFIMFFNFFIKTLIMQGFNAKLSDFGFAIAGPAGDDSHVSARVMGTFGYAAPEYIATGIYCEQISFSFPICWLFI